MRVVHPEFLPDPSLSREEMETLQRELAALARFEDDLGFDPADLRLPEVVEGSDQSGLTAGGETGEGGPTVVGVDQAFLDDRAISAVVAVRDGRVVERVGGSAPLKIPYIPGLLSFREGGAIVDALERLTVDPDLLVVDGSGRIHFRQAGLATHVGVLFDLPAVGVAKGLLCGTLRKSLDEPLPAGTRVAIEANDRIDAPAGTVVGYAYQSRQFANPARRHVNPLFVSPGHRVGAETAVDLVERLCAGYKLPEPTRLADAFADELKGR